MIHQPHQTFRLSNSTLILWCPILARKETDKRRDFNNYVEHCHENLQGFRRRTDGAEVDPLLLRVKDALTFATLFGRETEDPLESCG